MPQLRNFLSNRNLLAVSARLKEIAINTEQTLDTSMAVTRETVYNPDWRREDNSDELTGKEEPDTVYDLGAMAGAPLTFGKAQAQHFGFGFAYGLGIISTAAWGTGYEHTITPLANIDVPFFTLAFAGASIYKKRYASNVIDTLEATFERDSWARLVLGCQGTGKQTTNMFEETVNAAYNSTSLTLAANAVEGSTAQERLDAIHNVRVQDETNNQWIDVVVTAVSAATPAVLTITAPGGTATLVDYKILYVPAESGWMTFPARTIEPPIRVQDLVVKYGGLWDGTSYLGGHQIDVSVESIVYNLNNRYAIEFRVGGGGDFANYAIRQGRVQTLTLNKQARDYLLNQKIADNEDLAVSLIATGEEFESGKSYYVDILLPQCRVLRAPLSVSGFTLAETGDLQVLEDSTYGSVRAKIGNKVATYAA